jgi:hypothetical protein
MTMGGRDAGGRTASCLSGARRLRWPHGVLRCGLSSGEEGCRAVAVVSGRWSASSVAPAPNRWLFARHGISLAEGE